MLQSVSLSLCPHHQVAVDTEEYDDAATLSEQVDELTEQLDKVCVCVCMYVCMCVCVCIYMYVCMYVCVCLREEEEGCSRLTCVVFFCVTVLADLDRSVVDSPGAGERPRRRRRWRAALARSPRTIHSIAMGLLG